MAGNSRNHKIQQASSKKFHMTPENLYKILLNQYRPQKWWPTTENGKLKPEYSGGPKNGRQKLEVAIGAILAQNTSWKNAEKAIINLNIENLIDKDKLKNIKTPELEKLVRPSGFYRQKARTIKTFLEFLDAKNFGALQREALLELKGIGPETADSILLYACGKPEFVADAYTKRIVNRLGILKTADYSEIKIFFQKNLQANPKIYQEFHSLLVEHAKRFCRKAPLCKNCPLKNKCAYCKHRKIDL